MKFNENPDTCSCCEGIEIRTPLPIFNRPGLPALAYRIGIHADFLESMLARLSALSIDVDEQGAPLPWLGGPGGCSPAPQTRPSDPCTPSVQARRYLLRSLTTRHPDDPSIALLDAWAVVADVLTFYQERIANEGYLSTALERRSVQELARLVGYKLRPGVAASVYLAFELDKSYQVEIPAGTRAQSVPQPGELPQPFETSGALSARYSWNAIAARRQRPQYIAQDNVDKIDKIHLEGLATQLKPNDPLLFIFGQDEDEQVPRFVQSLLPIPVIEPVPGAGYTIVDLQPLKERKEAQAIASHHLPLNHFGVPDSQTSQEMVKLLQNLAQARSRSALRVIVGKALHLTRNPRGLPGNNLKTWLESLETDLEQLLAELEPVPLANGPIAHQGSFPFLDQTGAQVKEPALRFASGSDLPRNLREILSPGAGAIPEMITTLRPRLAKTFYTAWGSAQTTPNSPLEQIAALRVKAAPFGYNAAPMPILDDSGALIGETEWPLESKIVFQVNLPVETGSGVPVLVLHVPGVPSKGLASIVVKAAGHTYNRTIPLTDGARLDLPVGNVIVEEATDTTSQFHFSVEGLDRKLQFQRNGDRVSLSVDDDQFAELATDQNTVVQIAPEQRVTGFYSQSEVGIVDENLMPPAERNVLFLDTSYDQILPESWVLIDRPNRWQHPRAFQVDQVDTVAKNAYKLSGKSTRLVLLGEWLEDKDLLLSDIRSTTVYAQSEPLTLVDERYDDPVEGTTIELDGLYDGLVSGRWIFVSGERVDIPAASGVEDVELAMIANVRQGVQPVPGVFDANGNPLERPGDKAHTTLELAQPLDNRYARQTVKVFANVTKATHGETVRETVGRGDARKAFQSFVLRKSPLTYLPAASPGGAESTLEMRVNDVLWPEVDHLYALAGNQRGYELRRDDDGQKDQTTVVFGDGRNGARLPTGAENIKAVYRSGIGKNGNVANDTIKMLVTRPLGVKGVNNPQRATGGSDRDDRDNARRNAPLAVMALDRLVSAQDYADFARMFAGIGKATARVFPQRRGQRVHVTIAGAGNIPIDVNSELYRNLNLALRRYGDPFQPFEVDVRELLLLIVSANVRLMPDYLWESVESQIRSRLLDSFGFERRDLGQDVYAAEVIATIQQTPGVAFVDLDFLGSLTETDALSENVLLNILPSPLPPRPVEVIDVLFARPGAGLDVLPAQLAIFSPEIPDTLILKEFA